MGKVSLKTLADALGLSPTTVSRALNGYPEVAETTRARVVAEAERLGYHPNARARSLATGRAMAIGHVIPLATRHEIVNPVFADFLAGAGERYAQAGYAISLSVVRDDDEPARYRELAAQGSVDGVMVHGPLVNDSRISLLTELGLPFLVHGRASGVQTPYSWLDVNNRRAFSRAVCFLADLGHRRIALVNGIETLDFAHRRRAGFVEALAQRGIAPDPALMSTGEMTEPHGYRAARAMLQGPAPPTAFLVASLVSALGVRRAIEERGLIMGRDVSVITHDDELSYFADPAGPPVFTATKSSVREAGRQAAGMLLEIIESPGAPPRSRLLEAELVIGASTGPAPETRRTASA